MTVRRVAARSTARTLLLAAAAPGALLMAMPSVAAAQATVAGTIGAIQGNQGNATNVGAITGGNTTTVALGNSRTILNWNGDFALGPGNTLNFVFGQGTDIVLNKVDAGSATINGALNGYVGSTAGSYGGNIWFAASNGVVFGSSAVVNTGGLLATSATIADDNFLFGPNGVDDLGGADDAQLNFTFSDRNVLTPGASVLVQGGALIQINGGSVALSAPTITTGAGSSLDDVSAQKNGDALFGAAESFTIRFAADAENDLNLVAWEVPSSGAADTATPISVAGSVTLGNVIMAARTGQVASLVVNPGAVVEATGAFASGDGSIVLVAGGTVARDGLASSGTLLPVSASGQPAVNLSIQGSDTFSAAGDMRLHATGTIGTDARVISVVSGDYDIKAAGFDANALSPNGGTVQGDITIVATSGALTVSDLTSNAGEVAIQAAGALTTGNLTAATNIELDGQGITVGTLTGVDLDLDADTGAITVGGLSFTDDYRARAFRFNNGGVSNLFGAGLEGGRDLTIEVTDPDGLSFLNGWSATGNLSYTNAGWFNATNMTAGAAGGSGVGNLTLSAGGHLGLSGAISAAGDTVSLTSATATITQNSGSTIDAATLVGSSGAAATLDGANTITTLGAFTANGFTLNDAGGLTVTGDVAGGANGVSIATAGAGATLSLSNVVVGASGGTIALSGADSVLLTTSQVTNTGGAVTFNAPVFLTGSNSVQGGASSAVTFNGTVGGDAAGGGDDLFVSLGTGGTAVFNGGVGTSTALQTLAVSGGTTVLNVAGGSVLQAGTIGLSGLSLGASGPVAIGTTVGNLTTGAITASVNNVGLNLTASGPGSSIFTGDIGATGAALIGLNVTGTARLNSSVVINGPIVYNSPFIVADGEHDIQGSSVTFNSTVDGTNPGASELFVRADTALDTGNVDSNDGLVDFNGVIGGSVALGGLAVAANQVQFTGTNNVGTLAANITGGGVDFDSGSTLTVGEVEVTPDSGPDIVTTGITAAGAVDLTTTGGGSNLILTNGISAGTNTVALNSAGSITGAGLVTGGDVRLNSTTGVGVSTTDRVQTSAGRLAADGGTGAVFVNEANDVTLATMVLVPNRATTTYDLVAGGLLSSEAGSTISATDIFLTAPDWGPNILSDATLQETNNLSITDTDNGGNFTLGAANNLTVASTESGAQLIISGATAGGAVSLTSAGDLTLAGNVDAAGDLVTLQATTGLISQTGGRIDSGSLTATAEDGIGLTGLNTIGTFTSLQNTGVGDIDVRSNVGGGVLIGDVDAANGDITLRGANGLRLVGGTTDIDAPSGNILFTNAVTVDGAVTVTAGGAGEGDVTFNGTVNDAGGGTGALTVNAPGTTRFSSVVGGGAALASLTTDAAGTTELSANVTTTGAQTYNDAVVLTNNATVASTGSGALTFANTVNGAFALTANTAGVTTFSGAVGGATPLTTLSTDAPGSTILAADVTTSATVTFGDALTLSGTGQRTITTGTAAFGSTVESATFGGTGLTVTASSVEFDASVGATNALGSLTVNGGTNIDGVATIIRTAVGQTYNGSTSVRDGGTTTFVSTTSSGNIAFNGQLNGADAVIVDTAGTTTFGGLVGNTTALTSLSTGAGGTTAINGGGVTTTGAQTYSDAVTLSANATLTAGASDIVFGSTLDGPGGLTATTTGITRFTGAVGGTSPLAFVTTNAGGSTEINGGSVTTSGDQTYGDTVELGADTRLAGEDGSFFAVDGNGFDLTLDFSGTTAVGSNFTNIEDLETGGGGTTTLSGVISTTGTQIYRDAVTLTGDTVVASSGSGAAGDITFADTVNGAFNLGVQTVGTGRFNNVVGGTTPLASLTTDAGGTTLIGATAINTTGAQTYADSLVLGGVLHTLTGGSASFQAVDDDSTGTASLVVNVTGAATFNSAIGATGRLVGLGVDAASVTFTGTNFVGTLAANVASGLTFTNGQTLTVGTAGSLTGVTTTNAPINLTTTGAGSNLQLNAGVNAGTGTVDLNSAGTIGQNASGVITAGTLNSDSVGATTLTAATNQIANLAASSANGFFLNDGGGLTVTGPVGGGAGGVGLTTSGTLAVNANVTSTNAAIGLTASGAGSDVTMTSTVNAGAGTVTLTATDAITQTAGAIIAGGLTGSSGGATNLGAVAANNDVATLGAFSAGSGFSYRDINGFSVTGPVNSGTGDLTLIAESGNMTLAAGLTSAQTVSLNASTGAITQTGGVITADTLTGFSSLAATLTGANQITNLGTFSGNGLTLNDIGGLNVTGAVSGGADGVAITTSNGNLTVAGTGSVTVLAAPGGLNLTTTGGGDIVLNGAVSNAGRTVTLTSAGGVSQNAAGVVTAGQLTGSSAGATTLTGATNQITNLGPYTANGLALLDGGGLTVAGAVNGGAGGVSLETSGDLTVNAGVSATNAAIALAATGASSDIALNAPVNAGTGAVTLTANGAGGMIGQNASGVVTAGTLTGSSNGATTLTAAANQIANLGAFTANGFSLLDAGGLTVTGSVAGGAGGVSLTTSGEMALNAAVSSTNAAIGLTTTGAGSDIVLASAVNAGTGTVTLTSAGAVSQPAGGITAGSLTGSAVNAATLDGANQITNLGAFTANGFRLTDAGGLTVTGAVNGMGGGVRIETSGDLTANAAIQSTDAAVSLLATGAGSDIALNAPVSAGTGTVTLTAGATIGQTAPGVITAATLTGSSGGATTLTAATNQLANLGAFTANGLSLLDGGGLTVTGAVAGGSGGVNVQTSGDLTVNAGVSATNAGIALTATGAGSDIALNAEVNAGAGTVTLTADGTGGTIGQNASGAIIAGRLTGSSDAATVLTAAANNVANLAAFSSNGFSLADASGGLNITGTVNARAGSAVISTVGDLMTTTTGSVLADTDIGLSATGSITARDLAAIDIALSAGGAVTAGTLASRDDVAIRAGGSVATGAITSGATLTAGGPIDRTGLADALAGPLPGHDIDIVGNGVSTGALRANGAGSDVRINGGAGGTGSATTDLAITAEGDIVLTGPTRGVDVALSSGGAITADTVTARDDIALRAGGAITTRALASGAAVAGQGPVDQAGAADAMLPTVSFVGHDIDAAAGTTLAVSEASTAHVGSAPLQSDARFAAAGAVTLAAVTADRDVLVDGSTGVDANVTTGALGAGRDVGVRANRGSLNVASASAGDDLVLRARSAIMVSGALTTTGAWSGGPTDQGADGMFAADATTLNGLFAVTDGSHVDVRTTTGAIQVAGATMAAGDARFQSATTVDLGVVQTGRDVLADGTTTTTAALTGGRDIAVRARSGAIFVASASAGDDVALRAPNGAVTVTGALTSGGAASTDAAGAADRLIAESGAMTVAGVTSHLGGSDVDVIAGTTVSVGGATLAEGATGAGPATSDARFQAGGEARLAAVTAERDVIVDGSTTADAAVFTGTLLAGRDVGVRSNRGALTVTGSASAGDEVVLRARDLVTVTGTTTSTGAWGSGSTADQAADGMFAADPTSLEDPYEVASGSDVDVKAGSIALGVVTSARDARLQADAGATVGATTAGRDVLADGTTADTGALTAGRDVAVRARSGAVTVASASAGDDVALRATGAVNASGLLRSGAAASADDAAAGVADRLGRLDPVQGADDLAFVHTGGSDVSVKAGADVSLSGVQAQRDALVDTTTVASFGEATSAATGSLFAIARDVQLTGTVNVAEDVLFYARAGNVSLGGSTADAANAFTLGSAEIDQITADSVNVFGGLPDGGSAPITIGDVLLSARMPVLRAYTTGDVTVSGAVLGDAGSSLVIGAADTAYDSPTNADAVDAPTFQVATREWDLRGGQWTADTIRVTGTIGGPADTTGNTLNAGSSWLGLVSLAGQTVLIFPAEDAALAGVGGFEEAVSGPDGEDPARLFSYSGELEHQIVADTFAVRASDVILQRNLDPLIPASRGRGLIAGRLAVDTLTEGGTVPTRMSLFGQLAADLNGLDEGVTLVDGASASTLVRDEAFGGTGVSVRFNAPSGTYRFNGCEIGTGGGCLTVRVDPSLPPIDAISSIGNLLDRFATIEDEPVTSTGVELFWFSRTDDEDDDDDDEEEGKQ